MRIIGVDCKKKLFIKILFACISMILITATGEVGFAENDLGIDIDWSVFQSDFFDLTIPEAPKLELKRSGGQYFVLPDTNVDRVLFPDYYDDISLYQANYTSEGYIIDIYCDGITFCFVQIGNVIYHYNFPCYIRCATLTADYATVLHPECSLCLTENYPVTSSGWSREKGGYRLRTIESGDLCAVCDVHGSPQYFYMYVRPDGWAGTVSMDPYKYKTRKDTYQYIEQSEDQGESTDELKHNMAQLESVLPKTLKEAEENWGIEFLYRPDDADFTPEGMDDSYKVNDLIQKNLINENYSLIGLYLDGNVWATDTQFDYIEGYNNSPIDSYDWQHITNGNSYFFILKGEYRYLVHVYPNPYDYDMNYVEDLLLNNREEEHIEEEPIYYFSMISYSFNQIDKNGLCLEWYEIDDDSAGINIGIGTKDDEEYLLTFNKRTGALEQVESMDYGSFSEPEWSTFLYP